MSKKSKYTRDEIVNTLQGEIPTYVKFVKSNGEKRRMLCSRHPNNIPEAFAPTSEKPIQENLEVIVAFDLEKKGWRSFRVDSVTEYGVDTA